MRALLDTHAMLWWLADDARLSPRAREVIADGRNRLLWSIASSWEIAVKVGLGKLDLDRPLTRLYGDIVTEQGVELVPISHEHCARLGELPLHHRDSFDRMLVVQALDAGVPILSADAKLAVYGVDLVW